MNRFVSMVLAMILVGCLGKTPSKMAAVSSVANFIPAGEVSARAERCRKIKKVANRRTIAAAGVAVLGSGGLSTLPVEEDAQLPIAVGALAVGVLSAALVASASASANEFSMENCYEILKSETDLETP
jgi:hypothetical protein